MDPQRDYRVLFLGLSGSRLQSQSARPTLVETQCGETDSSIDQEVPLESHSNTHAQTVIMHSDTHTLSYSRLSREND